MLSSTASSVVLRSPIGISHLDRIRDVLKLGAEKVTAARVDDGILAIWVAGKPASPPQLAALRAAGLQVGG